MSADPKLFQAFARTGSFSSGIPTTPFVGYFMAAHADKTVPTSDSKADDTSNLSKRRKLEATNLTMSPGFSPRSFPRSPTDPSLFASAPMPFGANYRPEGLGILPTAFHGMPYGVPMMGVPYYMVSPTAQQQPQPTPQQSPSPLKQQQSGQQPQQSSTMSMDQARMRDDAYSSDEEDSVSTMSVERSVTSRSVAEEDDSDVEGELPSLLLSLSAGVLTGVSTPTDAPSTPNTNASYDVPMSPDADSTDNDGDNTYQRMPGSPSSMSDKSSSSKKRRLRCPTCHKTFSQGCSLKDHMNIHNSVKPYICPEPGCGKAFSNGSNLNRHRRIHTGEKPYICEVCHKKFSQSSNLKVHIKIHQ